MRLHWLVAVALGAALLTGGTAHADARLTLHTPTLAMDHARPHLLDVRFDAFKLAGLQEVPLDQGGGSDRGGGLHTDAQTRQVLSFILGIIPGFGIGHLLAGSKDGFVLFLIVDVVLLTADILFCSLTPEPLCALGWVATIIERVFEGYDAYTTAGGAKLVERSVDSLMKPEVAECRAPRFAPAIGVRSFTFDFPTQ